MPSNNISLGIRVTDGSKNGMAPRFVLSAHSGSKISRLCVFNANDPLRANKSGGTHEQPREERHTRSFDQPQALPPEVWLERPVERLHEQPRARRLDQAEGQPQAQPREQRRKHPLGRRHGQAHDRRLNHCHAEPNRLLSHLAHIRQVEHLLPAAAQSLSTSEKLPIGPSLLVNPASSSENVRGGASDPSLGYLTDSLRLNGGTHNLRELHGPFPGGRE